MRIVFKIEKTVYDYYHDHEDYTLSSEITTGALGAGEETNDYSYSYIAFGYPNDWSRERAERYEKRLREGIFTHVENDRYMGAALSRGMRAFVESYEWCAIYRAICAEDA